MGQSERQEQPEHEEPTERQVQPEQKEPMKRMEQPEHEESTERMEQPEHEERRKPARQAPGLFVTGTDTGVGKTIVAAGIAAALRRLSAAGRMPAREVRLWKPVQTGVAAPEAPEADSFRLASAEGGLAQTARDVCALTYPVPLAPWMAARRAGGTIDYDGLLADGRKRLGEGGLLIVEGAGGLAVPVTDSRMIVHLAADLGLPLVIVARTGLGTVNHTLLTVMLARQYGLPIAGVVLNESSPPTTDDRRCIAENAEMIATFGKVPVLGALPWMEQAEGAASAAWIDKVMAELDWPTLLAASG